MKDIVYSIAKVSTKLRRHTLAVLVDNEFGVLARVIGLFSGRGYNIESLTVAEVEHDKNLSRITIVTSGTEAVIIQIKRLLERMVPVYQVNDLTIEGAHIEREVALVTLAPAAKKRTELLALIKKLQARVLENTSAQCILELTGTSANLDQSFAKLRPYKIVEMARSGVVAIKTSKPINP